MATRKQTAGINTALGKLFVTAPQNQTSAQKLAELGEQRAAEAKSPIDESEKPGRRQKAAEAELPQAWQPQATKRNSEINLDALPMLSAPWMRIQERAFSLPDPEGEHAELETALRLTDALTPGNLQCALNDAEDNARRAHRLYIVAKVEFEKFEIEMTPVVEAMRASANQELQAEKDKKERSKAITDADVRGRACVLFPDEWGIVQARRITAEGMMDHLKVFAEVWRQRCFSVSSMLNAGKRS